MLHFINSFFKPEPISYKRLLDLPPEVRLAILPREDVFQYLVHTHREEKIASKKAPNQTLTRLQNKLPGMDKNHNKPKPGLSQEDIALHYLAVDSFDSQSPKHVEQNAQFLRNSILRGHTKVFNALLRHTPNPDLPLLVVEAADRGDSAALGKILSKAKENQCQIPEELLQQVLHGAVDEDWYWNRLTQQAMVEVLLNHGVDPNAAKHYGYTPLHSAVKAGNRDAVQMLLDNGMDLNTVNEHGNTALHYAAIFEQPTIAQLLLDKGMNPNAKNIDGNTPLHYTAMWLCSKRKTAEVLLQAGADREAINNAGEKPLQTALQHQHCDLERLIRNYISVARNQ